MADNHTSTRVEVAAEAAALIQNGGSSPLDLPAGYGIASPDGGAPMLVPAPGAASLAIPMGDAEWPPNGAISLEFALVAEFADSTLRLHPEGAVGHVSGQFINTPFLSSQVFFSRNAAGRNTGGGINFYMIPDEGERILFQLPLSHLRLNQRYFLIINWSSDSVEIAVNLQGIPQGDLGHWRGGGERVAIQRRGDMNIGSSLRHQNSPLAAIAVADIAIHANKIDGEAAARMADRRGLNPLRGEARTVYGQALDLEGVKLEKIYEAKFDESFRALREAELLDGDHRVTMPGAADEWVLEGEHVSLEIVDEGLRMSTALPDNNRDGAWVLWLNRPMPANSLVEYSFSPETDTRGLNILFFGARNPNGESIFDLDLPPRRGSFREYIVGAIDSYHVSPWATDGLTMRRTANMRKNSGFALVAVGDDRLAGTGKYPKHVRVLNLNGRTIVEADGGVALDFTDDGFSHGPVISGDGLLGVRFMPHTHSAVLHSMKIYAAAAADKD